ncbi:hypothetical protein V1515DRAFT_610780 [Lipomyces mesembrius]
MGPFVTVALQKCVSAYVGEGQNRWCASHRDDAAKLYRLAVEKAMPECILHAVAEECVPLKATEIGKQLNTPVASIPPEKVGDHFGWFQFGATADNAASNAKTRERLGWTPTGVTVIQDVPVNEISVRLIRRTGNVNIVRSGRSFHVLFHFPLGSVPFSALPHGFYT